MSKNLLLCLLLITGTFAVKAQKNVNFVPFAENLYIAKFEVTNGDYRQFIDQTKNSLAVEQLAALLPDSTQWVEKFKSGFNEPMTKVYHWHPAFDDYPVVNITKEGMLGYCKWLADQYNAHKKRQFKKVAFRLPTNEEWMMISTPLPGHNLPWYGAYPYTMDKANKVQMRANLKIKDSKTGEFNYMTDGAMYTSQVGVYEANGLGIYDVIGNVAEFTGDGHIKGGSWANTLAESTIEKEQNFNLPDPRVGFRLVMVVVEK